MNTTEPILGQRFEDALIYGKTPCEKGTKRSCNSLISPLMGVASIALEYGADEDEAIAPLLRDAIED